MRPAFVPAHSRVTRRHTRRHARVYATLRYMRSPRARNLRAVQVLLGRASIATTERYLAVDDAEIRAGRLCPAVGAVDLAAVDYLAEREPVVPVRDAEEHALATVDERDRHIAAALSVTAAGDVAVRGVVRLGWRRLHAADLEVHRTPVVRLAARAVGVDGQALPVGTPLSDERTQSRHVCLCQWGTGNAHR
jgi:hypothetical protein